MKKDPKVAFILVCWNNEELLAECLNSIAQQDYQEHVTIVVDNGSKDGSVKLLQTKYPWVELHEAKRNLGFAKGNNRGISAIREKYPGLDYLVFLNTDARLSKSWLSVLIKFVSDKTKAAILQSTMLDYYDNRIIDSTHIYISQNGAGTQAGWGKPYRGETGPRKVFGVNAAAAMITCSFIDAQPFKTVFDETLFMYLEDIDLSARATIMGWDNYHVPGTAAYHMGSASSGKQPGYSFYMTYRNNIAVLMKNIPISMLIKMIPSIILSDYHTIRHLRTTNRGTLIKHLIKGRVVGVLRLPLFIPTIMKMSVYRKNVCKEALWELMKTGD
ncbi:MAG TPA: glycosyltransferase family 2 protein [Candidatus Dormibacteraeota bacterium]|nr:glycosyltransferase family 2 protein [Candidatus Dormibacteraeota bacterium]